MRDIRLRLLVLCCVAFVLFDSTPAMAADIDLTSEFIGGATSANPGEPMIFTVQYSNLGNIDAEYAFMDFILPVGAFLDEVPLWYDDLLASYSDTLLNVPQLFFDNQWCDSLLVQTQGPGDSPPIPMNLPASTTGQISLTVPMPMTPPLTPGFVITDPPELADPVEFNRSGCFTDEYCGQDSCFGPRFSTVDPAAAGNFEVADDGTGNPTAGCEPLVNDMTGKIALIRRGFCEFSVKALNAETAGAVGVVVMNDDPGQSIFTVRMTGGTFGHLITIPVAMVSAQDGDAYEAFLGGGQTITARMGAFEADALPFSSWIFHDASSPDNDPAPDDNIDTFVTRFADVFSDGFESGDFTGWTTAIP